MTHEAPTTPEAKIAYLAEKVMGWKKQYWMAEEDGQEDIADWAFDGAFMVQCSDWNPLTDWNHWRQVEERVIENQSLLWNYIDELACGDVGKQSGLRELIEANLTRRVDCLIAAHSSLLHGE